jgi:hypothetical protein
MFGINSVVLGGLAAGLSIAIVLGSLLLTFTESGHSTSVDSIPTLESVGLFTPTALVHSPVSSSPTITPTKMPTLTSTAAVVLGVSAEPEICDYPIGWFPYTIERSDTLNNLSASVGISPQDLADANCLQESRLTPDSIIFLPPATSTPPPVACGAPRNWLVYSVQQGDTLFDIAQRVNSTVSQLKNANCLNSDNIRTGQKLYVPYLPAPKPSPTPILATQTPLIPTSTQVPSPTPTEDIISNQPPPYPYPSP